jgi:hypothetical protein
MSAAGRPSRALRSRAAGVFLAAVLVPAPLLGQVTFTVEGRVFDAVTNGPVVNALVTVETLGERLSTQSGGFTFTDVPAGAYLVRVEAFGYEPFVSSLPVAEDLSIALPLTATAIQLDSLIVGAETRVLEGRVRDPERDINLMNSQVASNQGHELRSNVEGRFDLQDVWVGAPLRLAIRSFGYLPLDTTFVPVSDEQHLFNLTRDTFVDEMIEVQNQRLEERAGNNLYGGRSSVNRDDIVDQVGHGSLMTLMESKYPMSVLSRIVCVVFDDRQVESAARVRFVLENTLPENMERLELLQFQIERRQLLMLRVYTRRFFVDMMARNQPLRRASMVAGARGFVCE